VDEVASRDRLGKGAVRTLVEVMVAGGGGIRLVFRRLLVWLEVGIAFVLEAEVELAVGRLCGGL
jgi:hypothetical protein